MVQGSWFRVQGSRFKVERFAPVHGCWFIAHGGALRAGSWLLAHRYSCYEFFMELMRELIRLPSLDALFFRRLNSPSSIHLFYYTIMFFLIGYSFCYFETLISELNSLLPNL